MLTANLREPSFNLRFKLYLGHQQQRPPAHQLAHHEAEERGQEVGQPEDQGAVLGSQTQPGLLCRRIRSNVTF